MKLMKLKNHVPGMRRLLSATISAALIYLIVRFLGEKFGLGTSIDPIALKLVILTAVVSAFITKEVHRQIKAPKGE